MGCGPAWATDSADELLAKLEQIFGERLAALR
jgi:hypothetical protein